MNYESALQAQLNKLPLNGRRSIVKFPRMYYMWVGPQLRARKVSSCVPTSYTTFCGLIKILVVHDASHPRDVARRTRVDAILAALAAPIAETSDTLKYSEILIVQYVILLSCF